MSEVEQHYKLIPDPDGFEPGVVVSFQQETMDRRQLAELLGINLIEPIGTPAAPSVPSTGSQNNKKGEVSMDNDLISRSALRKEIDCCDIETYADKQTILEQIALAPTVEAEPVVHARWKKSDFIPGMLTCTNCGVQRNPKFKIGGGAWNRCPNCGAKMDLVQPNT